MNSIAVRVFPEPVGISVQFGQRLNDKKTSRRSAMFYCLKRLAAYLMW